MISRAKAAAALTLLALGAAGACNSSSPRGSETNWFGECEADRDCSVGHCICRVCSEECDGDRSCPGGEPDSCRTSGSAAYSTLCGRATPAPRGVCLHGCGGGSRCAAGFECEGGACVPKARMASGPDAGATSSGAQALTLTTFTTPIGDGYPIQFGACLPQTFAVDGTGQAACRILVHGGDDPSCRCDQPGLKTPSEESLGILTKFAHDYEFCGVPDAPPCENECFCEVVQQSGAALASCQQAGGAPGSPGWCYVDPGAGAGDPGLVEQCADSSRRLFRLIGTVPRGRLYLGCSRVEEMVPHDDASPAGPLGARCTPQDEFSPAFPFFLQGEITVDTGSPGCASGTCLVRYFRGRSSCPYGQRAAEATSPDETPPVDPTLTADERCYVPGASHDPSHEVTVPVDPQFVGLPPEDTVYCSCRCDGPSGTGPFCECPDGFACEHLIDERSRTSDPRFAGSYCVKTTMTTLRPNVQVVCDRKQRAPRPVGCDDP